MTVDDKKLDMEQRNSCLIPIATNLKNESRQDTICFTDFKEGNKETREASQNIVKNFGKEKLEIERDIDIEIAHRT